MNKSNISRRTFLKFVGAGAAGTVLYSCGAKSTENSENKDALAPAAPDLDGEMTYRTNNFTGDTVSILGYGCMRLPTTSGTSAQRDDGPIDRDKVNAQVDHCLKHGVNYFDTSPAYCQGRSEETIGNALSRHPRNSYYIATKLSNFDSSTWPAEKSKDMFENSLKYLQTDYVDYLLLHAVGMSATDADGNEIDGMAALRARYLDNGILDWLEEQKRAGRIRNLGFSYHGDVAVFDYLLKEMDEGRRHWDFVQIQHNYVDWDMAREVNPRNTDSQYLYNELAKRDIPVVVMEPLLGGRLASVPNGVMIKMKQRRPNDSVASWAFRFAGSQPKILTVLSGMTYDEHINDNLHTYSPLVPMTADEENFLHDVAREIVYNETVPCTGCYYCMPCPYGVDIPAIFAHFNKSVNEDHAPRSTRSEQYDKARKIYLGSYDRAVPRERQAAHCIGCGACVEHCPQGIAIPDRLHDIDRYTTALRAGKV